MRNELKIEKLNLCDFLSKKLGYNAKLATSSTNCDIQAPNKKIRIQTAITSDLENKEIILYLGTRQNDGINWRLIRSDYFIIIDPLNYYIMHSKDLKELIEINNWHWKKEYQISSKKDPRVVLIKIPKEFIVYGLAATNDIKIFNKPKNKNLLTRSTGGSQNNN